VCPIACAPVPEEQPDPLVFVVFQSTPGGADHLRAVCASRARANAFVRSQARDGVNLRIVEELLLR
jgi:hypothetical protein